MFMFPPEPEEVWHHGLHWRLCRGLPPALERKSGENQDHQELGEPSVESDLPVQGGQVPFKSKTGYNFGLRSLEARLNSRRCTCSSLTGTGWAKMTHLAKSSSTWPTLTSPTPRRSGDNYRNTREKYGDWYDEIVLKHNNLQPKPIDMSHPSIPSSQHSVSSLPRQVRTMFPHLILNSWQLSSILYVRIPAPAAQAALMTRMPRRKARSLRGHPRSITGLLMIGTITASRLLWWNARWGFIICKNCHDIIILKDLKKADILTGKADPYVQVHLLPGSHEVVKTKVVKKNYNPMFNETFTFPVSTTDVDTKTVVLQVKLRKNYR